MLSKCIVFGSLRGVIQSGGRDSFLDNGQKEWNFGPAGFTIKRVAVSEELARWCYLSLQSVSR